MRSLLFDAVLFDRDGTLIHDVPHNRGPDGCGRACTYPWPDSVVEIPLAQLVRQQVGVVVLPRPHEAGLATAWLGYLHLCRWTSLGLSLLEAMAMGVPVAALATTEAVAATPPGTGSTSTNVDELVEAARWLLDDPAAAGQLSEQARRTVHARYHIDRFLADWDRVLEESTCGSR